ncbi:nickel ABC transporter substrate-binding protein [Oscillibacter sp. GMB15532]|uniref:nickel ABC transporter substrate-binding protein n=1 Tax=Oscillibacter sp. GMB15532 TaxID=3230022 RepID=UPI0034DEE5BA
MKKRLFAALLGSVMLLGALSACGQSAASGSSADPAAGSGNASVRDELNFVNFRDIRDLNPHLYAGEMYAQSILYDTLVRVSDSEDATDGVIPCLAESWEITEEGKVYLFHIRQGVTFTDGAACDAHAIKANFDAILENKNRHTWLEMMNVLESVEAVDEYTLEIRLTSAYYPMLIELGGTRPFAIISPNCMIDGSTMNGVNGHIGTGPYVLTDFVTDEYAVFERNDSYWGEAPAVKKITVKVIPDNQTRIMALESGEIDLIYGKDMLDAEALTSYMESDKFTVELSAPISTRQLLMNTTDEVLGDVAVRKALQHATNKQAISDGIFSGLETPADFLYSSSIPYCDVGLVPYDYDMEEAAAILDEAGWTPGAGGIREKGGVKLSFGLLYCSDRVTEKNIAEYLQQEFRSLGIEMDIHGEEEQSYRDNMKSGNFDMVFNIAWGTPQDPQSSMAAMRAPVYGDFAAQQGLDDKGEIDQAITDILVSTDETGRQELYSFVLTRLHEDAVYIPLTYECNKALHINTLDGVEFDANCYRIPLERMFFN